jgi:hypothetical protein
MARPARVSTHAKRLQSASIFSVIQFYHEPDIWLFGGVFRVLQRYDDRYEVELADEGTGFVGRLKLRYA